MQRTCLVVVALILLGAVTTIAQTDPTSTGSINTATEITPAQRSLIKRHTSQHQAQPVRLERMIPAGTTVPNHVEVELLPAPIVRQHPHLKAFGYFASDTGTYIVDPYSRKVVTSID